MENVYSPVQLNGDVGEDEKGGMLPGTIVFPFQVAESIWELMVISLVGTAWQALIWGYIALDWAVDSAIRLALGTICKPCAWLAIWAFKLPTFPFIILGWFFRIMIESMGLMVGGWMLFFGGSGCYLRWGHNCWFVKRFKYRSYWQIADLTIWMRNPSSTFVPYPEQSFMESMNQFFTVPEIQDMSIPMQKTQGSLRRTMLANACPINKATVSAGTNAVQNFFGL